jgi:hypothetical protein
MGMARYSHRFKIGYKRICGALSEIVDEEAGALDFVKATWVTGEHLAMIYIGHLC